MKYLKELNWSEVWPIIKEYILPHSGKLVFNGIIFAILGFLIAIIYLIIIHKKGLLKRKNKYYNWAVKLYYPLIIFSFIYIFIQTGLIRGGYKILSSENKIITTSIYNSTINLAFSSEQNKKDFILKTQETAKKMKIGSNVFLKMLLKKAESYNTGNALLNKGKNIASSYLITKYGDDIFKNVLYGMLAAAGTHINITESLPYNEYSKAVDFLLTVEHQEIEKSIKSNLESWYENLLTSQYNSIIRYFFIILLLIASIPILEYFIYKKWIEPTYLEDTTT